MAQANPPWPPFQADHQRKPSSPSLPGVSALAWVSFLAGEWSGLLKMKCEGRGGGGMMLLLLAS